MKRKVIWSEKAKEALKKHHDYIKMDSPSAARRVKSEIINASKELAFFAEKYQIDDSIMIILEIPGVFLDGVTE